MKKYIAFLFPNAREYNPHILESPAVGAVGTVILNSNFPRMNKAEEFTTAEDLNLIIPLTAATVPLYILQKSSRRPNINGS